MGGGGGAAGEVETILKVDGIGTVDLEGPEFRGSHLISIGWGGFSVPVLFYYYLNLNIFNNYQLIPAI